LSGELPTITPKRAERAAELLFNDLERHDLGEIGIARNASVLAPGVGEVIAPILVSRNETDTRILAITAALTPHYSPDVQLREVAKSGKPPITFIDELQIRRNLPRTTSDLIRTLSYK
jgi:hypothetical protein